MLTAIYTALGPGLLESVLSNRLGVPASATLLINFHIALIKKGIARFVNGLEDDRAKSPSRKEPYEYLVTLALGFQGLSPWLCSVS